LKYLASVLLVFLVCTAVFSGVVGVSHREDPPRIVVYIEHDRYRDKIPETVDGFKVEVVAVGRVRALSLLQLEEGAKPYYTYVEPVSRTGGVRPVVGGISIGVPEKDFGGRWPGP
jgi:hypothetical protein